MEIRKDYIINRWTYIAESRGKRPKEFEEKDLFPGIKKCFFCPGNEEPELEIGRIKSRHSWLIRWINNKYPSVFPKGEASAIEYKKIPNSEFFHIKAPIGHQEVIIETPVHNQRFCELPQKHLLKLFHVYQERIREAYKMPGIKYVSLFKNFGPESGASIVHSHTQLIAVSDIPERIMQYVRSVNKYKDCPYCQILRIERKTERFITENEDFIAFAPFAPRFSYEVWILPKKHRLCFNDFNDSELINLGKIMKKILRKLKMSYNFYFIYSPVKKHNLHFRIEITPRRSKWAGFELLTGRYIVSVSPEEAARYFRR